jgi:hypothetical protein
MIEHRPFPNLGYIFADVPKDALTKVRAEVDALQSDFTKGIPYNGNLVGNIEKEFELNSSKRALHDFVNEAGKEYFAKNTHLGINPKGFFIHSLWANFMKAGEFNPLHNHFGALSFVIWLDIPYDIDEEFAQQATKNALLKTAGCFEFAYTDALGMISMEVFKTDKTFEGKMLMFPSQIKHAVNPFYTSDKYRISIAGNLLPM